jgi:DNA mismatch repair protein MutL
VVIRRLDPVTIGQIAAGEVIERPVSVVKELVENALDAGATRIAIAVRAGGFDEITVSDDGGGIAPEELPLAVERHSTSKLLDAHGFAELATLGFRGEGLASIAAVARVSIVSRRPGDDFGACVEAFEDTISPVYPAPGPPGTRVAVRDLFTNLPVRREYLRSAQAEATRIANFVTTLALGYPGVAFSFWVDGHESFALSPVDERFDRLTHVFGREVRERMMPIAEVETGMHGSVRGYLSRPGHDRGDRRLQLLFVNGRVLKTTALSGAWTGGYAGYAMVGRHPYGVLFLDLPPDHVDPNVHPTKAEVRFRYNVQVVDTVRRVIVATLHRDAAKRLGEVISLGPSSPGERPPRPDHQEIFAELPPQPDVAPSPPDGVPTRPDTLRVLAQLDRAFLLATDGRALVILDQHAAHERVAYERIAASARVDPVSQPLLVPETIELERADAEKLEDSLEALRAIGVEIEAFGERVYRVMAMPAILAGRRFDLRGYLDALDDPTPGLDAREHIWATMACHSVVRAGERMEPEEMRTVVERLALCENPMHCPHGRPTIVRFDPAEIAKLFKRT